ncbi:MAG TPA: DUF5658 family protein [Vicinamibacterales bacterium]|nr:DUF5658 family protein [Vicinamibacterales bacterium]
MAKVRTPRGSGRWFGDIALVVFLLAQLSDGVLTYIGVATYGPSIEGNPIIAWLMSAMGEGPALATAKITAGVFGIALHLSAVHRVVAMLAAFYLVVAIAPWMAVLYLL